MYVLGNPMTVLMEPGSISLQSCYSEGLLISIRKMLIMSIIGLFRIRKICIGVDAFNLHCDFFCKWKAT